MRNRNRKCA